MNSFKALVTAEYAWAAFNLSWKMNNLHCDVLMTRVRQCNTYQATFKEMQSNE